MREGLLGLLAAPQSLTRRAACESMALLANKMMSGGGGTGAIESTVQTLVDLGGYVGRCVKLWRSMIVWVGFCINWSWAG